MLSFADPIVVLWGWRRAVVAMLAGAASSLAFAPFDAFPVLWITLPILVWLIDGATTSERTFFLFRPLPAAVVGWCFGFGFFLAGMWWIGLSFLAEANIFAWLMPFAVLLLPAALALFWAAATALARIMWCEGWPRIVALALTMTTAEWLRGHVVLGGLPWNTLGYALMPRPVLMQSAAVLGLYGVTFLAVLIFAAPAALADPSLQVRRGGRRLLAVVAILLLAHVGFGIWRLAANQEAIVSNIRIRVVQPAVPQRDKWQKENAERIFERYLELSDQATSPERNGVESVTHLIWPESAFPFLLTESPEALSAIADLLPPGTTLITGALRAEPPLPGQSQRRVFNSIYVIGDDGTIRDAYDKVHLVPIGEYLPFQTTLEALGLEQLTRVQGGFSAGTLRRNLSLPGAPAAAPLICYEAIFSNEVVGAGDRPGWLLNVTNDAWFGDTPGPRQHLRQAVLRAVEEGLPLVRAANTGISAIADPFGRIVAYLPLNQSGVLDGDLPEALSPTPVSRFGNEILIGLFSLAGLVWLFGRIRTARQSD